MSIRRRKLTQSDLKTIFKAAAEVGQNARVEFHTDGTIVAAIGNDATMIGRRDQESELEKWMEKHRADPT